MSNEEFKPGGRPQRQNLYAQIHMNLKSYSGFISLLRELIQNSDDSTINGNEVHIEIRFHKDRLLLKNNTVFSERDWDKIQEIGSQNKEHDLKKTGRFGIGFTSVYKICDKINIHSLAKSCNVDLNRIEEPDAWREYNKPRYPTENVTEFEFFWRLNDSEACKKVKAEIITTNHVRKYIQESIDELPNSIHFLKNTTKIDIYDEDELIQSINVTKNRMILCNNIHKERKIINVNGKDKNIVLYHKDLQNYFHEEYKNEVARRKPFLLTIAFHCDEFKTGRLYCTLPTEMETGFPFDIDCDFQPDPNRKQIILAADDPSSIYNSKILNFVPDLLYEILDDFKEEIPAELFYQALSTSSDSPIRTFNLFSRFHTLIKENDSEIINLNSKWYSISKAKILIDTDNLVTFLEKINYPIIPKKHLEYSAFFNKIGVKYFQLNDFIQIIEEKIPSEILLEESVIGSEAELEALVSYIQNTFNQQKQVDDRLKARVRSLYIFLNEKHILCNLSDKTMFFIPDGLDTIKDDLPILKVDNKFITKFKKMLFGLGVKEFSSQHLKELIYNDFSNRDFPIELSHAASYLNSRIKLKEAIQYLGKEISLPKELEVAKQKGHLFINGSVVNPQQPQFKSLEQKAKGIMQLPLVLSQDNKLYPISNESVYDLNSKYKEEFASRYGLNSIDLEIKKLFENYNVVFLLSIRDIIFHFEQHYQKENALNEHDLVLMYHLILEEKSNLIQDNKLISKIRNLRIFRNTRNDFCALENNGKTMMLQGNYPIPIPIPNILDEALISKNVKLSNFRNDILKSIFKLKELSFEYYIKDWCNEIFMNDSIKTEEKIKFTDQLNDEFHNLEKKPVYKELKSVIVNSKLIYCNDGIFHSPASEDIYFKSAELDELFGRNYRYPHPRLGNIDRYEYFFKQMGVKEKATPNQIVSHVTSLANDKHITPELIERLSLILLYINKLTDSFKTNDELYSFRKLAEIEWLPALGGGLTLYKPSSLYLQNTKPFLSESNDILYLSLASVNKKLVDIWKVKDTSRITTDQIIENLRVLSIKKEKTKNLSKIYSELNKRVTGDSASINHLKSFPSICVEFKDEKPQYYYPSEVFTDNLSDTYGYDYIGFLSHEFIANNAKLIESLGILNRPDFTSLISILKKIESKYQKSNYIIEDESDKMILQNCLKELNKIAESTNESRFSQLKNISILCNQESKLITPNYAILEDNPNIAKEFRELGDRFVKPIPDIEDFICKLEIKKLSSLVHKEMLSEPDLAYSEVNTSLTQKIRFLSKLFLRIKSQIGDRVDKKEWREIDSNIEVIHFKHLRVSKYIILDDQICRPLDGTKIDCYIEIDNNVLRKLYVKNLEDNILFSISSELIKEIHPNIELSLTSLVLNMLEKDSYEEMYDYLTSIGYPDVSETKDTTLRSNKQIEEYSYSNSNQELDIEEYNYDVDTATESDSILINEEQSYVIANNNVKKNTQEYAINKLTSYNTESLPSKSNISLNDTTSKKHFNEKDVNEDLDSPIIVGRTTSPTKNTDFKETIAEKFAPGNGHSIYHEKSAIFEHMEPMSLEDENIFKKNEFFNKQNAIEESRYSNSRRGHRLHLDKMKNDSTSIHEVKSYYNGKCQICDHTFQKKSGGNYCEIVNWIELSEKGISYQGNMLCLCPNHAALLKYGNIMIDRSNWDKLRDNKLIFSVGTKKEEIKYHPTHFKMLKVFLEDGDNL